MDNPMILLTMMVAVTLSTTFTMGLLILRQTSKAVTDLDRLIKFVTELIATAREAMAAEPQVTNLIHVEDLSGELEDALRQAIEDKGTEH